MHQFSETVVAPRRYEHYAVRLLVLFGTEFRQLEAAHPEIASRIAEVMRARADQVTELA